MTAGPAALDVQALWAKYEDIAMHFNDLLMRLRTQSLAGIAAVSTLVGLFSKEGVGDVRLSWEAATAIFIAMALFWVAVWCLDLLYYNRLLVGAVHAITRLEAATKAGEAVKAIEMSTMIEDEFRGGSRRSRPNSFSGVVLFYLLVLAIIIGGAAFCGYMLAHSKPS